MAPNKNNKSSQQKSMNRLFLVIGLVVIVVLAIGIAYAMVGNSTGNQAATPTPTPTPTQTQSPTASVSTTPTGNSEYSATSTKVLFHTSVGDITFQLRDDKPITTSNFVNIVNKGWYDGTIFHRVIAGFMIQGGATNQNISPINDEIGTNNTDAAYTIAMAKTSAPNSATSQFFINVANNGNNEIDAQHTKFDTVYTEFGRVIAGQNIVNAIANAPVTTNQYGENSQPVNPVTLISATVVT